MFVPDLVQKWCDTVESSAVAERLVFHVPEEDLKHSMFQLHSLVAAMAAGLHLQDQAPNEIYTCAES